jgi:hypothetical protein
MSQENVELLRGMYGRNTLWEFAESLHPQAELHQAGVMPDADDYFGRDEFLRGALLWHEEWEEFSYLPQGFADSGERVLVRVRVSGRGRNSGIELDLTLFHVWTFRENLPWRCQVFVDEAEALEAVGLSQ